MSEYRNYTIDLKPNEWGYFEGISITDCDAYIIRSKSLQELKDDIDFYLDETLNKYSFNDIWNAKKPKCGKCEMLGDIAPCDECYLKSK